MKSPSIQIPTGAAPEGTDQSPRGVREMFGAITPTYDRLNRLLSGAMDQRWRKVLARELTEGLGDMDGR